MTLTEALAEHVEATIRARGKKYFQDGAVKIDAMSPTAVSATVRGTSEYDVVIGIVGDTVETCCSCPYAEDHGDVCKHIWATLLAVEPKGFAGKAAARGRLFLTVDCGDDDYEAEDDDEEDDYVPPPRRPAPSQAKMPARPARPATQRAKWEDQLAALQKAVQPTLARPIGQPTERQLVYLLDAPGSEQAKKLVLEVHVRDMKKNGEWGKPRAQTIDSAEAAHVSDPLDRRILALLGGAERGDSYGYGYYSNARYRYRLDGPLLDAVLPLLAESGRVHLRRDPSSRDTEPLVQDLEPAWELKVAVGPDATRKNWVLAGHLLRGEERLALEEPTLVVPGLLAWNGRYGRLNDGGAFGWIAALRKAGRIAVPLAKSDEFLRRLMVMPALPRLDMPGELSFSEVAVPPRPRLVVSSAKNTYGPPMLRAALTFDYEGTVVPAEPSGRGVFEADGKRFLLRDAAAEADAARELGRLGFRPARAYQETFLELKAALLPKAVGKLVAAGWKVEAEGKLYRQPGSFEMAVHSDRDWFDLSATADFEGQPVPLPRLLEALRRGETSVVLDDGSLGMVPEEWLKRYGAFAQMGTVEGDSVRFGKAQVGVLDALLASRPEVAFDEHFARARDELRSFQGIAPADPPPQFRGELREYQREGLGWLRFLRKFGFGGCLADDMGLGKTVQVLAFLAGERNGPALVVVPRSLVYNWKQEAAKFAPDLKVLDHTGLARDRTGATFGDYDLVVTTYGTLRNDAAAFSAIRFDACVLDESQAAKNATTETAKAVKLIRADHLLALSGTPVENHLGELWTLFDFLNPGMLGRAALFGGAAMRNPDPETRGLLAQALRPFTLRRTKDQVAKDLPAKTEQTLFCDLEPEQRKLYDELRDHYRRALLSRVDSVGMGRAKIQVLEALLRLRQAACHPGLIDKGRVGDPSAKLDVLLPQLRELAEEGHKALVFSQFTSLLSIVKSRLDADGATYEYLDGRTRDRQARVERFQTDRDCRLFLVSLKAGGVGLNLTAAEYVFLLDPWWNPAVEAQAIDRSHRIGQTKPVFAYRLIARNTVEEKVLALQEGKRALADAILGGDGRLITDLKREDLELLLS